MIVKCQKGNKRRASRGLNYTQVYETPPIVSNLVTGEQEIKRYIEIGGDEDGHQPLGRKIDDDRESGPVSTNVTVTMPAVQIVVRQKDDQMKRARSAVSISKKCILSAS